MKMDLGTLRGHSGMFKVTNTFDYICLLYTSDAADEMD